MNTKPSFDAIINVWQTLSEEEKREIIENPNEVKKLAEKLVVLRQQNTFVTHLSDEQAVEELLRGGNGRSKHDVTDLVQRWRRFAACLEYTGPVAWKVKKGFTLRSHAPLAGPCSVQLLRQDWRFEDEPTCDAIVFWVPRMIDQSLQKTADGQMSVLASLRNQMGFPEHHLSSFGLVSLLSALILAHFKRVGERVPGNGGVARTGTLDTNGRRLRLWWSGSLFDCANEHSDQDAGPRLGVFALGVEVLGQ